MRGSKDGVSCALSVERASSAGDDPMPNALRACSAIVVAGVVLGAPSRAGAAEVDTCAAGRPYLVVRVDPRLRERQARLVEQLRESLAARHVEVCVFEEPRASDPLATLEVTQDDASTTTSIVVNDGVTEKRVRRELDLRDVPEDGRSLAIAVALDELLRASWAELLLVDHRPVVIPPVVTAAIARPPPLPSDPVQRRWEVGGAFAAEHFGAGQDQLGMDAIGAFFPLPRLGLQARAGARAGLTATTPSGELRSSVVVGALGLRFALTPASSRLGADLIAEAAIYRISYEAIATTAGAHGRDASALAAFALAGSRVFYALTPTFRTTLQAGIGAPIHEARVRDDMVRVSGLAGLLLAGQVGLIGAF